MDAVIIPDLLTRKTSLENQRAQSHSAEYWQSMNWNLVKGLWIQIQFLSY